MTQPATIVDNVDPCPTCGRPTRTFTLTTPEPLGEHEYEALKQRFLAAHTEDSQRAYTPVVIGPQLDVALLQQDIDSLAVVGRMYLDALEHDPENEMLTLPEAYGVTQVREAVERAEARGWGQQ